MNCFRCFRPAVIYQQYSGRHLCTGHLAADIETRAKRTIRQNHWLAAGDRIAVPSGMKHSDALYLFLTRLIEKRRDISLVRLTLQAIPAGREALISAFSSSAEAKGATKLALPDCAEDVAAEVLSALLRGDAESLLSMPYSRSQLPVMIPLWEIPGRELDIYTDYYLMPGEEKEPENLLEYESDRFNQEIRMLLDKYSQRHPSAPHALRRYRVLLSSIRPEED